MHLHSVGIPFLCLDCLLVNIVKRDSLEKEFRETHLTPNSQACIVKRCHCSFFSIICVLLTFHQFLSALYLIYWLTVFLSVGFSVCLSVCLSNSMYLLISLCSVCPCSAVLYLYRAIDLPFACISVHPSACPS